MIIIYIYTSLQKSITLEIKYFRRFEYLINHPTTTLRNNTLISLTRNEATVGLLSGKEG
mgnify:CR=1 FL=1